MTDRLRAHYDTATVAIGQVLLPDLSAEQLLEKFGDYFHVDRRFRTDALGIDAERHTELLHFVRRHLRTWGDYADYFGTDIFGWWTSPEELRTALSAAGLDLEGPLPGRENVERTLQLMLPGP